MFAHGEVVSKFTLTPSKTSVGARSLYDTFFILFSSRKDFALSLTLKARIQRTSYITMAPFYYFDQNPFRSSFI